MPCLFCQRDFGEASDRKRTREHIFADWMTPYLKSPVGPGTQVRWDLTAAEQTRRAYPAYPAQQAVQGVCHGCNSGWLSGIQTDAKPHLLSALKSTRRRTWGETAQNVMTIWAYRAALMAGIKGGAASIPSHHLHDFYELRALPESTRVWMVATAHRELTYIDHRVIKTGEAGKPPPTAVNGFASLIGVGHVAFYVVSWSETRPRTGIGKIFENFGQAVAPVFPIRGPVTWPPRKMLNEEGLDQLAGVIGVWKP